MNCFRSAREKWEKVEKGERGTKRRGRADSDSDDDVLFTDGTRESASSHNQSLSKSSIRNMTLSNSMDLDELGLEDLSESQLKELQNDLSIM